MSFCPTRDELARMYPRALPEWLDAMARLAPDLCRHYEVSRLRWVHLAGQIGHETQGMSLKSMTENMRFTTASRILEVYSYRLGLAVKNKLRVGGQVYTSKAALARALVNKPRELAIVVYSGREGTPAGQGDVYIGRGPTQITHRNNYRAVAEEICRQPGGDKCPDLAANPELLATDPELGIRSAFADFALKRLWRVADADDVDRLSDILNTGNANDNVKPHGLANRRREVARAKAIWPDHVPLTNTLTVSGAPVVLREGSTGPHVSALQAALARKGYQVGATDGVFGTLTARAVVAFEHEHGLVASGEVDWTEGSPFRQALDATAPADLGARATLTAADLQARGSTTIRLASRLGAAGKWIWRTMFGVGAAEASGVDVIGQVSSAADTVGGVVDKAISASSGSGLRASVVLGLLAVGILGWLIARWSDAIVDERVSKAQSGADIST